MYNLFLNTSTPIYTTAYNAPVGEYNDGDPIDLTMAAQNTEHEEVIQASRFIVNETKLSSLIPIYDNEGYEYESLEGRDYIFKGWKDQDGNVINLSAGITRDTVMYGIWDLIGSVNADNRIRILRSKLNALADAIRNKNDSTNQIFLTDIPELISFIGGFSFDMSKVTMSGGGLYSRPNDFACSTYVAKIEDDGTAIIPVHEDFYNALADPDSTFWEKTYQIYYMGAASTILEGGWELIKDNQVIRKELVRYPYEYYIQDMLNRSFKKKGNDYYIEYTPSNGKTLAADDRVTLRGIETPLGP